MGVPRQNGKEADPGGTPTQAPPAAQKGVGTLGKHARPAAGTTGKSARPVSGTTGKQTRPGRGTTGQQARPGTGKQARPGTRTTGTRGTGTTGRQARSGTGTTSKRAQPGSGRGATVATPLADARAGWRGAGLHRPGTGSGGRAQPPSPRHSPVAAPSDRGHGLRAGFRLRRRSQRREKPPKARWFGRGPKTKKKRRGLLVRRARLVVVVFFLFLCVAALAPMLVMGEGTGSGPGTGSMGVPTGASAEALGQIAERTGIPQEAVAAYVSAEIVYKVDWEILAGIGQEECNHGRSGLRGCLRDTANHCGARGPMQFLGNTWRKGTDSVATGDCPGSSHFTGNPIGPPLTDGDGQEADQKDLADCDLVGQGYATDGDGDDTADPWNWLDATHSAARLLICNGLADGQVDRAIRRYNNSERYVGDVLRNAERFRSQTEGISITGGPGGAPSGTGDMVNVPCPNGGGIEVADTIAEPLRSMLAAAAAEGFQLCGGGYRTHEEQIQRRRAIGCPDIWRSPPSECDTPTAIPGTSMHEVGLAVDLTCSDELIASQQGPCYQWLAAHAARYGLYNLPGEPWHWSTTGT